MRPLKKIASLIQTPRLIDSLFSLFLSRSKFFNQGWGEESLLKQIQHPYPSIFSGVSKEIDIVWSKAFEKEDVIFRYGTFKTPYQKTKLPRELTLAQVELVLPKNVSNPPVCIHFASTGDEGFGMRRKSMAIPLAKKGIASIILANPYYGSRKPPGQKGYQLKQVVDLGLMMILAVHEGKSLVRWLKKNGFHKVGVTGISMGAYTASLVASYAGEPLAVIPCLSTHSPEVVFIEGVMRRVCHWDLLQKELGSRKDAKKKMKQFLSVADLRKHPIPHSSSAIILVAAAQDAIVPEYSSKLLHRHWKGSQLRSIEAGHVTGFLFYKKIFQAAIVEAFEKLENE